MTQNQHGNGDVHRANPDPVETRDREMGRAEFRDPEKRTDPYHSSHYEDAPDARRRMEEGRWAGHDDREPGEIERDIERTRADMDDTLDALQRKFSPGQLMDQAIGYLRSGPGGFASNFGSRVRDNPMPIALTAIGIGWLMFAGDREDRVRTRRVTRYHYDDEYGGATDRYSEYGTGAAASPGTYTASGPYSAYGTEEEGSLSRAKHRAAGARDRATGMAHDARDRLGAAGEGVRERMHDMRDRASGAMSRASGAMSRTSDAMRGAGHRAGEMGHMARRSAQRTREGFTYMLDEHPFTVGAVGIAIGACLGAMLPSSRRESEWMGEARDEFIDRAKEYGRDEADRLRKVAESAASAAETAAEEEADRQGLSGEKKATKEAAGSAKAVAGTATETSTDQTKTGQTPSGSSI